MSKTILTNSDFSKTSFYIKFYPKVKTSLGCEKATLILGRMEYWFNKYTNGFYKFIEPCPHPLYKEGDSWLEELGFSRKIFARAFDLIGVRYKSKSAYLKAIDKFQGKLYASYHDRKSNKTFFIRNHDFASQFIKGLFKRKTPSLSLKEKKEETKTNFSSKTSPLANKTGLSQGRSWNGQKSRSYGGDYRGGKEKDILIQRNTSSLETNDPKICLSQSESLQSQITEEMIKIWKEEIGDLGVGTITAHLTQRIYGAFESFFDQSLESWKSYCQMISSSKFLMGEAQNKFFKKAWITWAIKEESISRIRAREFKFGDRPTNQDKKIEAISNEMKNLENRENEIIIKINNIKQEIMNERQEKIKQRIKYLSKEETRDLEKNFETYLNQENNSMTEEFKKSGWKGLFVQSYFEAFVEERLASQLFATSSEEEAERAIKGSGYMGVLENIHQELSQLKQKKEALVNERNMNNTLLHSNTL